MAKHNEAVINVTEVFSKLAEQAETLLNDAVSARGERITKSSLAKTLTDLNHCNPMLAAAVVEAYMVQRDDLQSSKGFTCSVGQRGERRVRSISDTAKMIQNTSNDILDTVKPEDRLKTRDLVARVAAKVKLQESECRGNVIKSLQSRKDIRLVKGPFGGIRKLPEVQPTALNVQ